MMDILNLKHPIRRFFNPDFRVDSFYVKSAISPCGLFLASGSSNGDVFVWDVSSSTFPPYRLQAHTKEVAGVSWSNINHSELASCSDDASLRIWKFQSILAEKLRSPEYPHLSHYGKSVEGVEAGFVFLLN